MPEVFSKFVSIVFGSIVVPNDCSKFDVYTKIDGIGQVSYPIYLDPEAKKEIYKVLESEFPGGNSGLLQLPYNFFVADFPISFTNLHVLPSHIYYSFIRFESLSDKSDYWDYFNWNIGLG